MKKLLLVLLLLPGTIAPHGWPTALTLPLLLPILTGNAALTESIADGLNFNHSRGISFQMAIPSKPDPLAEMDDFAPLHPNNLLTVSYNMRWGYQGAGKPTEPFAGVKGKIDVELSYEGLSFNLCKSRSLRALIYKNGKSLLTITPCEEFYVKLAQLVLHVSQTENPDIKSIRSSLETLFQRLQITPDGTTCTLYGMPILNTPAHPGLELFLRQAPDVFTQRFIIISQKLGASMGLITNPLQSAEKQAYLRALLDQIDYFNTNKYHLNLPRGGTISLDFDSVGAGDAAIPLQGTTLTIEVPQQMRTALATTLPEQAAESATSWDLSISPEQECVTRLLLLILHNRKKPMPSYQFAEEVSTLLTRLSLSPTQSGKQSSLRAMLSLAGNYHQQIMRYSFDQPLTQTLGNSDLLLQLARVAYKTYALSIDQKGPGTSIHPQDIADFAVKNSAEALRNYQGTQTLREVCRQKTRTPYFEKNGIILDLGLFFSTLLSSPPKQAPAAALDWDALDDED